MIKTYCDFCEEELTPDNSQKVEGTTWYLIRYLHDKRFTFALEVRGGLNGHGKAPDICKECLNDAFELAVLPSSKEESLFSEGRAA